MIPACFETFDILIIFLLQDSWVSRHGAEPRLPGVNYTPRQLFWVSLDLPLMTCVHFVSPPYNSPCLQVSAANVWCAKYRPKALKLRVLTGVHSPDQFRVQVNYLENSFKKSTLPLLTYIFQYQGPFSNMDDFSRDFNCPVGSNMNPPKENKCQVKEAKLIKNLNEVFTSGVSLPEI